MSELFDEKAPSTEEFMSTQNQDTCQTSTQKQIEPSNFFSKDTQKGSFSQENFNVIPHKPTHAKKQSLNTIKLKSFIKIKDQDLPAHDTVE